MTQASRETRIPPLAGILAAGAVLAGLAFGAATPAAADRGHHGNGRHGHGGYERHVHGPSHVRPVPRRGRVVTYRLVAPIRPYPRYPAYPRYVYAAPPANPVVSCAQGVWRHPDGYTEQGLACLYQDGSWRMAQ